MDWKYLKDNVYFSDGSLRDIYVLNSSRADWIKWIDFVNDNYKIDFNYFNDKGEPTHNNKILYEPIFNTWDGISNIIVDSTVHIDDVLIKCYFFSEEEIENDIEPSEVKSLENHNRIMDYLKSISKILNKEVILTIENYSAASEKLIIVDNEQVLVI